MACSQKPPAPHGGVSASRRGAGGGWHPAQRRERRREEKIARSVAGCQPLLPRRVGRAGKHAPAQTRAWARTHGRRGCEGRCEQGGDTHSSHAGAAYQTRQPARERARFLWGSPRRAFARARCGGVHPTSALNTPSDKAARVKRVLTLGYQPPQSRVVWSPSLSLEGPLKGPPEHTQQ